MSVGVAISVVIKQRGSELPNWKAKREREAWFSEEIQEVRGGVGLSVLYKITSSEVHVLHIQ